MPTLWDCFLHWRVAPDSPEKLATGDAILTHEFGDQRLVSKTTATIVQTALGLQELFDKPLVCQYPGNEFAEKHGVHPAKVIMWNTQPGCKEKYLDTNEVNRQVASLCWARKWQNIIVCTHPHHQWRAGENLRKFGLTPLYPDMSGVSYDWLLTRHALSTPLLFVPREILARVLYLCDEQL